MKRYDDYLFMSSQPQLYQHVKDNDPELYEEIKKRIKEGRWEPEGAMWLEADTNLASGESLMDAMKFACTFASLSVTKKGAANSMPTFSETEAFMKII